MADLEDGEILDSDSDEAVDKASGAAAGVNGTTEVKCEDGADEMTVDQIKDTPVIQSQYSNVQVKKEHPEFSFPKSNMLDVQVKKEPSGFGFHESNMLGVQVKKEPSQFGFHESNMLGVQVKNEPSEFSFHESNVYNLREQSSQFGARRSPLKPNQNKGKPGMKYNDDVSSESSDEDTDLWKCKKARYFSSSKERSTEIKNEITSPPRNGRDFMHNSNPAMTKSKVRKINNIWGSVLAEQDVSDIFSTVGVEKNPEVENSDRNVEKYDFTKKYEDSERPYLAEVKSDCHDPFHKIVNVDITDLEKDIVTPSLKRKRTSVRDRIMDLSEWAYDEKKSREHYGVTFEDSDAKIVNAIAIALDEPKIDLIAKCVEVLGSKKALETAYLTEDVEDAGGMMTFDGHRRRTPGGVYIQLLKKDKDITKQQYTDIFGEEERKYKKACRMEQRRRKQEQRKLYNSLPQSRYNHYNKNTSKGCDDNEKMDDGTCEKKHHKKKKKKKKKKKRRDKQDSEMKEDNDSDVDDSDNSVDNDTGEVTVNQGDSSGEEEENFDEGVEDIVIG